MAKERKYPLGYRPKTALVNLTVKYWPKSADADLRSGDKKRVNHALKKVVTLNCTKIRMTVDGENNPPTEKLKRAALRNIWEKYNIKVDLDSQIAVFRNIEIISSGRVNYDFDEFIH